jgi:hypothetical protein
MVFLNDKMPGIKMLFCIAFADSWEEWHIFYADNKQKQAAAAACYLFISRPPYEE